MKLKSYFFRILFLSIGIKIIYFLFALSISRYTDKIPDINFTTFQNSPEKPGLLRIFKQHDSGWYQQIATNGHHKINKEDLAPKPGVWQQSYYAFFPLYPLLSGAILHFVNFDFDYIAFLWSLVLSTLCFWVFFLLAKDFLSNAYKAFWATLVLIIFPFHFYFSMFMTEALFLLLLALCFLCIRKNNKLAFSICAALLVLSRPNGIFMAIPLYAFYVENKAFDKKLSIKDFFPLEFMAFPATMVCYCIYLNYMTGDFLAFSTAQKGWDKHFQFPLKSLFNDGSLRVKFHSVYSILIMLFAIFNFKKWPLSFNLLIWINILLPLSAGTPTSMARYISVIFPLFFLLGSSLRELKYKELIIALLFSAHLWSYYYWLTGDPLTY
jgi:Gpi18-like mannosyltransferase